MNKRILCIVLTLICVTGLVFAGGSKEMKYSFSTAGTGGTYYPMGGGIANLLTESMEGVSVTAQTSGGSAENLRLIQGGEVDMAWANGSEIFWAWNGEEFFEGDPCDKVRVVSFAWTNTYHFAALRKSGITKPEDFVGKKVGIGPQGSGAAIFGETYLRNAGLFDKCNIMYLPPDDQSTSLKDRNIDVFGYFSGIPMAALIDVSSVEDIYIIDLKTLGDKTGFTDKYPFYSESLIKAGTYTGQERDVISYSNLTYWVASEDVPAEVIYEMLKALYADEGLKYMLSVHKRSSELSIDMITNGAEGLGVPLHEGTIKFLEEQGL